MPGHKHLYIPGPTNMPEVVRMAMNLPMEDMRAPDFPDLTRPIFEKVAKVFRNTTGRVFIYPSSGTGAWEAAIQNTLSPGDRVLMSRFGQFSPPLGRHGERFGLDVDVIDCAWGEGVPVEQYAEKLQGGQRARNQARSSPPTTRPRPASLRTSRACARRSTPPTIRRF